MKTKRNLIRMIGVFLMSVFLAGNAFVIPSGALFASEKADAKSQSGPVQVVNVNKASLEELETVRGIGPTLASRIIQYRDENGAFKSSDDLMNVSGIGAAKLQKIKSQISV